MTNRRYGSNKYGDGKLYGPTDDNSLLSWGVEVDWDGDGYFDGSNEAGKMTKITVDRGREFMLQAEGKGFETIKTGKAKITLLNSDGRYDALNATSPLYPNVSDNKDVRIRVKDMDTGTTYPLFYGVIEKITPINYQSTPAVQMDLVDGFSFLRNYPARVAIQTNIAPHTAVGLLLDAVGYPSRWGRSLDTSFDVIPYFWATSGAKAGFEIERVANSFLSLFYIDAQGRARYANRTNAAAVSVVDFPQEYLLSDITNRMTANNHRNVTRLKTHPRVASSTVTLYQLAGNAPSVETGASNAFRFFANYTYNNVGVPALSVITPVATTDYLFNTSADGTGTDITASCTLTIESLGDTAKVTATNNYGSTAYLTKCNIRGVAVYEQNDADITYPSNASSVVQPREFFMDLPWLQYLNTATDLANTIGPFLDGIHPFPQIKVEARPDLQFPADLFDIVTANIPKLNVDNISFRVGGIHHESTSPTCQAMRSTFYLEPYITSGDFWTFPIVDFGTDTIFGW